MGLIVRPFRSGDLRALSSMAREAMARPYLTDDAEAVLAVESDPFARTAECDGVPVASGGLAVQGPGVALAWAVFASIDRRFVVPLFRAMRDCLRVAPYHWIEAQTPADLPTAARFDRLLGFRPVNGPAIVMPDGRQFERFVYGR